MDTTQGATRRIVGGVDTHKDLHVAAVVDERDIVIGTRSFDPQYHRLRAGRFA
jgi:transposase